MKLIVVLSCVVLALAAPQTQRSGSKPEEVQLLRLETDNDGLGSYRYAFEQSDGTKREEHGELKNAGKDNEALSVEGSYSWISPDGESYIVSYIADENGYSPTIQKGLPGVGATIFG